MGKVDTDWIHIASAVIEGLDEKTSIDVAGAIGDTLAEITGGKLE